MIYNANATRDNLYGIELVEPAGAGSHWQGIQHGELADCLVDSIMLQGWRQEEGRYSVSDDGYALAASVPVTIPTIAAPDGQRFEVGLLTSNNRRRALTMVVGTQIAVCTNGMCTGEIVLHRKHCGGLDLMPAFREGLDKYAVEADKIATIVAEMRDTKVDNEHAAEILMTAGHQKLLNWSNVGKAHAEYLRPRHEEHGAGTAWCLFNAFTEIIKGANPLRQMDHINNFRTLLPITAA